MNKLIFDIGGTYIKYAYVSGDTFKVGAFPVIDDKGKENLPNAIERFIRDYQVDAIGVSAPAPFDYEEGVGYMTHKLASLYHYSLRKLFNKYFPKAEVMFIHDAVAFMLGTTYENPHLRNEKVACVMIGTGLGYAYMEKGLVWVNDDQVTMPELGFQKYKDGVIEDYVSATALLNFAREAGYRFKYVKDMSDAAKHDTKLKNIFEQVGMTLGEVLNARQKIDKFNLVVIGGGVSKTWPLLKKGFEKVSKIKYEIINDSITCPINGVRIALKLGKDKIYLRRK